MAATQGENEWPEHDYQLFVGNLDKTVGDSLLAQKFSKWPSFVKARVVRDLRTHRSKGYGFVSFLDAVESVRALREMNNQLIGPRCVRGGAAARARGLPGGRLPARAAAQTARGSSSSLLLSARVPSRSPSRC